MSYEEPGQAKGMILVVDDTPANLRLLTDILTQSGYTVRPAPNGALALKSAQVSPPNLILLDIMMPGLSGYEVCEHLKADPRTRDIPILFISALTESLDKVKAFTAGGVDYITKPFQVEEILARVQTHLNLRRAQQQLQEQNQQLQRQIVEREQAQMRLRESEQHYRSIFENVTVGIFQATSEGHFLTANPAIASMLGYSSPQELVETVTNIPEQIYIEPSHWRDIVDMLQLTPGIMTIETRYRQKDGGAIFVRLNIWSVRDEQGNVRYFEGILEDETERKRTEEALEKRETYLSALVEIQQRLLAFGEEDFSYPDILELLGTITHVSRVYVFENHIGDGGRLLMSLRAEWCADEIPPRSEQPALQNILWEHPFSRWREELSHGRILSGVAADFPETEQPFLASQAIQAILILPLMVNDEFFGFIGFDNCREARAWSMPDVSLLHAVSTAIAIAKERQISEQRIRHQRQIAESLRQIALVLNSTLDRKAVLAKILEQLRLVTHYDSAGIFLREGSELVLSDGINVGDPYIGRRMSLEIDTPERQVFWGKQPYILVDVFTDPRWEVWEDDSPIRSWMGAPLLLGENIIGILTVDSFEIGKYQPEDAQVLQLFAHQAAIAIGNAELFDKVQHTNRELEQALKQLQTTQHELIQAEKMAALGQLVAGVAHEINSPLGAIRSSIENVATTLNQTIEHLPMFLQSISDERQIDFFALLHRALHKEITLSSIEERKRKRALAALLMQADIPGDVRKISERLVNIGIYDDIQPFLPLLQDAELDRILSMVYALSGLQESTRIITEAISRASKVVFALKTYARYDQSGERVQSDITEGIETALTLYHNQLKHGVEISRFYKEIRPIWCYPDELTQVWTNLIQNAIQAMKGQGKLAVDVSLQHLLFPVPETTQERGVISADVPQAAPEGDHGMSYIVVHITDSGNGIPDEIKTRIFEPFFTTKPAGEGSGLGLDICRKIIEKHHGSITFESRPGSTTFSVFLPTAIRH